MANALSRETMFAYKEGEAPEASQEKTRLRSAAKKNWPFLMSRELAGVGSEQQLTELVRSCTGRTEADATQVVRNWIERQQRRTDTRKETMAYRPTADWESEGGEMSEEL